MYTTERRDTRAPAPNFLIMAMKKTDARSDEHTCHARGCEVHVPPKMFMCKRHWRMVPYGLRVAVWAEYQPGQERLDGTALPTDEYLDVTREAIDAVAAKEGL